MTTLATDQLVTELAQPLTLYRDQTVAGIRARFYFHNNPSGVFHFKFYRNGEVFETLDFTTTWSKLQIQTLSNYFWIDIAIKKTINIPKGDIVVKLESTGYLFSTSTWIGWCKDFGGHPGKMIGDPQDFTEHPFNFKLIEYMEREN